MTALPVLAAAASVLACVLAWELLPAADVGPEVPAPRPSPVQARTGTGAEPGLPADVADSLLARPLFSPDRRPAAAAPHTGPAIAATLDVPRLSGIVIGPMGARAIFDDGSGRPKIAAEGDSLGRFKVGPIAFGQVSLIASEGERVLRPKFVQSSVASAAPPPPIAPLPSPRGTR